MSDDLKGAAADRSLRAPLELTDEDIDQIIEGIENFCIGPETLRAIWQPYIDKLEHLKASRSAVLRESDLDHLRALLSRAVEIFDPGGNLPEDCQAWASELDSLLREALTCAEAAAAFPRAPEPDRTREMDNIPEFTEPRFWVAPSLRGFGVFYRLNGRKLGVGGVQNVEQAVARNVAKALNDVVDDEVAALPRAPEPDLLEALVSFCEQGKATGYVHLDHCNPQHPGDDYERGRQTGRVQAFSEALEALRAARSGAGGPPQEPRVGDIWKASDGRRLRVVSVEPDRGRVGCRNVDTNRLSYVQLRYFNGAREGHWSIEREPESAGVPPQEDPA